MREPGRDDPDRTSDAPASQRAPAPRPGVAYAPPEPPARPPADAVAAAAAAPATPAAREPAYTIVRLAADRRWPPSPPDVAIGAAVGLAAGALLFGRPSLAALGALLEREHLFGNVQAIVQTLAILVGGWWAYVRFVRTREGKPKLDVRHEIEHVALDADRVLLHVAVRIENRGTELVELSDVETRVQHVHPLRGEVLDQLVAGARADGACLVAWRTIDERTFARGMHRLEPGEQESAIFEFVVSGRLRVASIYTFVPHASAEEGGVDAPRGQRLGWSCRTLYRIDPPEHAPAAADAPRRLLEAPAVGASRPAAGGG